MSFSDTSRKTPPSFNYYQIIVKLTQVTQEMHSYHGLLVTLSWMVASEFPQRSSRLFAIRPVEGSPS